MERNCSRRSGISELRDRRTVSNNEATVRLMWVDQNRRPSDYKTMTHPVCKNSKTATKKRLLNQKSANNLRLSHKSHQLNSRLSQQNQIFEQHSNCELRVRLVRLFESKSSLQDLTPIDPSQTASSVLQTIKQYELQTFRNKSTGDLNQP